MYSNCCCSSLLKPEIIKIGQSCYKLYSNNIRNFQECTTIFMACKKKSGNLLNAPRMFFEACFIYCFILWILSMVLPRKNEEQVYTKVAGLFMTVKDWVYGIV